MQRIRGFTLIEIAISVFILMILLLLAVPSIQGVLADRRLQRSLTALNQMVHQAQEHSVKERRSYLIVWEKKALVLRPEAPEKTDTDTPVAQLNLARGEAYQLRLPAALEKNPSAEWIFWPSGTCEPANVSFTGPSGTWEVNYAPLTGLPNIARYVTR